MKILTYQDIYEPVRLSKLIEYLENTLKDVNLLQSMYIPKRNLIHIKNPLAVYGSMAAYCKDLDLFITKSAAFVYGSQRTVSSIVCAFTASTGKLLAVLNGEAITNLKCSAITGLVNNYCAAEESKTLGIVGCGVQAREQLRGIIAVRDISNVKVYSRDKNNVLRFISEMKKTEFNKINFECCETVEEATSNIDILSTATTSFKPLFEDCKTDGHLHINAMGAHTFESREINLKMLSKAKLIVENRQTAVDEAGKIHDNAIEIQELHIATKQYGLKNIFTIFSSTGYALLDLITTSYVINNLRGLNEYK